MNTMRLLLLSLAFVLCPSDAETVAWQIPVELVVEGGLEHPEITKLEESPAASAFFKPGDELWDLSRAIKGAMVVVPFKFPVRNQEDPFAPEAVVQPPLKTEPIPFDGEFVVWNRRSEMIIGRGTPASLGLIEDAIRLQAQPFSVITTFTHMSGGREKIFKILTRSGERGSAKDDHFDVEVAPSAFIRNPIVDLNLCIDVAEHRIQTSVFLQRRTRQPIASWKDGPNKHTLLAKSNLEMAWGVPADRIQFVETGSQIVPMPDADALDLDQLKLDTDLSARVLRVPPDFVSHLLKPGVQGLRLNTPPAVQKWIPKGLIDLSPGMRPHGVGFAHPGAMVGYDPLKCRVIAVHTPENLDLIEMICSGLGPEIPVSLMIKFEWQDGLASIAMLAGAKAEIARLDGDQFVALLEAAPSVSHSGIIDVVYRLNPAARSFALHSSVLLRNDQPLDLATGEREVAATATLLSPND